jgi:phosphatidylinositol-3-phosphatase
MRLNRTLAAISLAAVAAGCGSAGGSAGSGASPVSTDAGTGSPTATPTTRVLGESTTASAAPCGRTTSATYAHVIWIWMENRDYGQVLGANGAATHLKSYARKCAVATRYYAITHPSLPNYLAAVSGSTGGVTSDCSPSSCLQRRSSIFEQLQKRDHRWAGYAESMQSRCDRASYGRYAARHNPAVYFPPIHSRCLQWDTLMGGSSGRFATALKNKTLPSFAFVTPNLCDDGHDCSTTHADDWLGTWLSRIVASPSYDAGHTAVFVTWDEGLDGSSNRVATVVIAPSVTPGTRDATRLTHYSLLRTAEKLLGLPLLGHAKTAHGMVGLL